ncbi:hypothetical protein BHE74_00016218 [Ensete ventricosum]|nr:hypothetical protein GW17_00038590 [Ensete ventricosum]RWW75729.1 hypothetical protein BHE74_00016218 [Ensete ventricosum]RZR94359.1 hypothetical protein BHM03_00023042 [Ensete ventricosum]
MELPDSDCNCCDQGLQFRLVPPGTGGTYRSVRLPLRGPPATGRFCQKSIVGGRLKKKSTVSGRLRKKKGRRRGKEEKKKRRKRIPCPHAVVARARGRFFSRARRRSVSPGGEKDRGDYHTGTNNISVHRYGPISQTLVATTAYVGSATEGDDGGVGNEISSWELQWMMVGRLKAVAKVEEQRDTKNVALIPNDGTPYDSIVG